MKAEKKVLLSLEKCYALSRLTHFGQQHFLVGAEKFDSSYLFHADGTLADKVLDAPGGVMTMEPIPGTESQFLCTREFYSPNDGRKGRIEHVRYHNGTWQVHTLVEIPMVHRFGILCRNGVNYLLVCTIKNDYVVRDDWRQPGAVYAAALPEDLSSYNRNNQLRLFPICAGLWRNHGFFKCICDGVERALIGSDNGLWEFSPPEAMGEAWSIRQLLQEPCSDAVLADFDGDGIPEIGIITPFHGDTLRIYKKRKPIWQLPYPMEMLHATWLGSYQGKPTWFVGCRQGCRQTIALYHDGHDYRFDVLDSHAGAANALQLDENTLVCTNYAENQVVCYRLTD